MRKEFPILIAAAIAGVVTVFLVNDYVGGIQRQYDQKLKGLRDIVVAKERLEPGHVIIKEDLAAQQIPEAYVHQNAVRGEDEKLVVGQSVLIPIRKGQALLWTDLEASSLSGANARIPKGYRAVTVQINGATGLLEPNAHVDIIGTFKDAETDSLFSITFLQNITVLAVNGRMASALGGQQTRGENRDSEVRNITVLVDPEQAEFLALAMELVKKMGTSIFCVLRSPEDGLVTMPKLRAGVGGIQDLIREINKERGRWRSSDGRDEQH